MIHHLTGEVSHSKPGIAVIECNGVGYAVKMPLLAADTILSGRKVTVFTHLDIKETQHTLYGFSTEDDRAVFESLISSSGVGGGKALAIMSYMTSEEIKAAIGSGNNKALEAVKGIGPKMAQQIILDLKAKYEDYGFGAPKIATAPSNPAQDDAVMALIGLGFTKKDAEKRVATAISASTTALPSSELIKLALK